MKVKVEIDLAEIDMLAFAAASISTLRVWDAERGGASVGGGEMHARFAVAEALLLRLAVEGMMQSTIVQAALGESS